MSLFPDISNNFDPFAYSTEQIEVKKRMSLEILKQKEKDMKMMMRLKDEEREFRYQLARKEMRKRVCAEFEDFIKATHSRQRPSHIKIVK